MRNINFFDRSPMDDVFLLSSKADDDWFRHPPRDEEGRRNEENQAIAMSEALFL